MPLDITFPLDPALLPVVSVFRNDGETAESYPYLGGSGVTLQPGDRWAGLGSPTELANARSVAGLYRQAEGLADDLLSDRITLVRAAGAPVAAPVFLRSPPNTPSTTGVAVTGLVVVLDDTVTDPTTVTLTGSSSDTTLLPNNKITFGGSGANRTVALAPAADKTGAAVVTLTATDAANRASTSKFTFTVAAP